MKHAIVKLFQDDRQVVSEQILLGTSICIHQVKINSIASYVNIFFEVFKPDPKIINNFEERKKLTEEVRKRLVHVRYIQAAPYLRGRVTRILGLKYAPELRFYPFSQSYKTRYAIEDARPEDSDEPEYDEMGQDFSNSKEQEEMIYRPTIPKRHAKRKSKNEGVDNIIKDE
jgi:hypothetical protein